MALKPEGRSLSEFEPLFNNYPAEKLLLEKCRSGELATISTQRPDKPTKDNTIRASFLRFLALGGDENAPVHEQGVCLQGAWVTGELNLNNATMPHSFILKNCHLDKILDLMGCNIRGDLSLEGGHIEELILDNAEIRGAVYLSKVIALGEVRLLSAQIDCLECREAQFNNNLNAESVVIKSNVFLDKELTCSGVVSFVGAQIGGHFDCRSSRFNGKESALACQGAFIKGNVFLQESYAASLVSFSNSQINGKFDCTNGVFNGRVNLSFAKIGANLKCQKAKFNGDGDYALICEAITINGAVFLNNGFSAIGKVSFARAKIGIDFKCHDGELGDLNADGMAVENMFIFQKMKVTNGKVSLVATQVGTLSDDADSWSDRQLVLDGFIYKRIGGKNVSTDAKSRIEWLEKQSLLDLGLEESGKEFKPQPWQQLQKVLREMGHFEDARQVGIAFEKRLLKSKRIRHCILHRLFGLFIGYGYRPFRLFIIMIIVWLLCGGIYWCAALYGDEGHGVFSPSNPLVFQNSDYAVCVPNSYESTHIEIPYRPIQGAGNWYLCEKLREEYTGFSPLAYSLDLILPLVDLQQEGDWSAMIPTPDKTSAFWTWSPNWKYAVRFLMWFEILFGWIASLLLVAVVSGLTKRREE